MTGTPVGIVELVDLLRSRPPADAPVSAVMREAVVLPTSMRLPVALERIRETRNELACVIDEYGNFDGILTIEDMTEEVIGELSDEHDRDIDEVSTIGEASWIVPGDLHLDELERLIGHDLLLLDDSETVAGLVISEHGDLPSRGAAVRIALAEKASEVLQGQHWGRWLDAEVIEVRRHVPSRVAVHLREHDLDADGIEDANRPEGHRDGEEAS